MGLRPIGAGLRSRLGVFLLLVLVSGLVPGTVVRAARGVMARAILVSPDGMTEELELTKIQFVHYQRRLAKRGKWEKSDGDSRQRSNVKMEPQDSRYQSRYLQWENEDPGVRLSGLCEIRFYYPEGEDDPRPLYLRYTSKKGSSVERKVLDLLGAHQPVPVHFAGKVVKEKKRDFPLPHIRSDGAAPTGPVLDRIEFLSKDCRND